MTKKNVLVVLAGVLVATTAAAADHRAAIERARAGLAQNAAAAFLGEGDALIARAVVIDEDGAEHVRFDRTYSGLRVLGGDLVVHHDPNGVFRGVSQTLHGPLGLATRPALKADRAVQAALRAFGLGGTAGGAELVIDADETVALAYEVVVSGRKGDRTPSEMHYLVDARSGRVRDAWDGVETTTGTGQSFFSGMVTLETTPITGGFSLKDPSRGNQSTTDMNNGTSGSGMLFTDADNAWGNGLLSNRQTIGVDGQFGAAETWDYYKNTHNRNGIRNDGVGALSRVHYSSGYNNAFWQDSCFCMTYGDGDGTTFNPFTSLDVAGHEMSHGVTAATAKLRYSGESGGLNEGTSDIFGTMVEFSANNPKDVPDYLIGEELYKSGTEALRYMYRPSKDGASADCYSRSIKSLDVHYSSGVANHFFYLLAEGSSVSPFTDASGSPTCNGSTVAGIGHSAAEKIWYRALSVYMTSRTGYSGARTATLNAAKDLYGSGSAQANAVAAAWSAVKVN